MAEHLFVYVFNERLRVLKIFSFVDFRGICHCTDLIQILKFVLAIDWVERFL